MFLQAGALIQYKSFLSACNDYVNDNTNTIVNVNAKMHVYFFTLK